MWSVLAILRITSTHWWLAFVLCSVNVFTLNNHSLSCCQSHREFEVLHQRIILFHERMEDQHSIIIFMLEGFSQGWNTDSDLGKELFANRKWQFTQLACPSGIALSLFEAAKKLACEQMKGKTLSYIYTHDERLSSRC